jgi:hypothetical protein
VYRFPIDKGAIGTVEVTKEKSICGMFQAGMFAGSQRMVYDNIIGTIPSNGQDILFPY